MTRPNLSGANLTKIYLLAADLSGSEPILQIEPENEESAEKDRIQKPQETPEQSE